MNYIHDNIINPVGNWIQSLDLNARRQEVSAALRELVSDIRKVAFTAFLILANLFFLANHQPLFFLGFAVGLLFPTQCRQIIQRISDIFITHITLGRGIALGFVGFMTPAPTLAAAYFLLPMYTATLLYEQMDRPPEANVPEVAAQVNG